MVTDAELTQFFKDNPPANQFVPYCHLNKQSDTLTVYFEGDADYSKRLNDHITLYLSLETKEIVGCRVKGISGILQDLPNFISAKHPVNQDVELSLIFFAFRGSADEAESGPIKELARVAKERDMRLQPQL